MNFMGTRQGFYEDDSSKGTVRPFSQSSSCSSSPAASQSQQKGLVPLSYLHKHQRRGVGPWDETAFRCYSDSGGGGNSQLDLMMDSSNNNPVDDADMSDEHHLLLNRAGGAGLDTSEGPVGGVGSSSGVVIEREHMFDKVVTPSDVGKLNRLVIPKQHAEKYFPLDSSTNEKGLLLNFEDRNGKPWRFRYSYWNSSQSYVMTKGWSRFVKEKKLDAGDIVSFHRGVGELGKDRLFINWRRRPDAPDHHHHHQLPPSIPSLSFPQQFSFNHPWNHPFYLQQQQQPRDHSQLLQVNAINSHQSHLNSSYGYGSVMTGNPCSGSIIYLRSATGGAAAAAAARPHHQVGVGVGMVQVQQQGSSGVMTGIEEPMVFDSVPVVQGKAAAKRLRLFGVNMDCPISEEEEDECDILSSTAIPHSTIASQPRYSFSSSSSSISPLQLRPYNGGPLLQTMPMSSNLLNKGKASMSLDLDI